MVSLGSLLTLAHLFGLALSVGAATAKGMLLLRSRSERSLLPSYLGVYRPLTRLIILGLILLTSSGIGWLLIGYPLTPRLSVKLVLVGALWILGPTIDHVVEPAFLKHAPDVGQPPTSSFLRAERRYVLAEAAGTGLFYAIVLIWVLG